MHRRILIFLGVIASLFFLFLGVVIFLYFTTWVPQAREGVRLQQKYDEYIAERAIDGRAVVYHYFEEVRLYGDGFNKNEIMRAKYIIQGNDLIKVLDISETAVSNDDIADLKHEYAPVLIHHDEYE